MKIDFWYGNKMKDVARVDCYFNDLNCSYSGNMYDANGKPIGDWWCKDSVMVEKTFYGIFGE